MLDQADVVPREVEATLVSHLRRAAPPFHIKGAAGEVDAAYVHENTFWPIEAEGTRRLRPAELKQVIRYPNAVIAGHVRAQHDHGGRPVLPAPVVLLRIGGWIDRASP